MLWRVFRPQVVKFVSFCYNIPVPIYYKMPFYAVANGRTPGIYMTWPDCETQVKGFPGAKYKKFDTVSAAQEFVTSTGTIAIAPKVKPNNIRQTLPNTSNDLKRTISTSTVNISNKLIPKKKLKSNKKSDSESEMSDISDDLSTIIMKQMDDIEARVKSFGKGLDKIIKKKAKDNSRKTLLIEPLNKQNEEFEIDNNGYVHVYTDGSCTGNGRSGAQAGLGVYWGDGHPLNKSAPVSGRATNNCGEIQAATCAIKTALNHEIKKLVINTDSKFLINSVTKWIPGWKKRDWKLQSGEPVKNEIDFKELDSVKSKIEIKWNYVEAHRGLHGNEMADQLAKAGAAMYKK